MGSWRGTHEIVFRVYPIHTLHAWKAPEKRRRWYETIYEVEILKRLKTLPAVDQRRRACELAHLPLRTCKVTFPATA